MSNEDIEAIEKIIENIAMDILEKITIEQEKQKTEIIKVLQEMIKG